MKRILCLLLAVMLTLCACGAPASSGSTGSSSGAASSAPPDPVSSGEETPPPPEVPAYTNPLTGAATEADLSANKPVAIMINNHKSAQPQQGISQADIIYEVLAEGGITRMLGVYQDVSGLGTVGSVRSARRYFCELALGHDAVFVHAGGSPEFYEKSKEWNLTTVDGVNGYYAYASTKLFWRDKNRVAGHDYAYEHSLVTSGERLTNILTDRGLLTVHEDGYTYEMTFAADGTPTQGAAAQLITVPFGTGKSPKTTVFRYEDGLYKAEQFGKVYEDGNDSADVAVTNLLILQTECIVVDDKGRITVDLSTGQGWYACGGQYVPIVWEKGERGEQLRYCTTDGQPLTLGEGRSYVCIIPEKATVSFQQ